MENNKGKILKSFLSANKCYFISYQYFLKVSFGIVIITSDCFFLGYCTNLDVFMSKLNDEKDFKPFGEKIHEYSRNDLDYEIYQVNR